MKIERKYLAHFINAGSADEPVFERLGKDLEEFSPQMSAQVEVQKNILGQSRVIIAGYEKTAEVEPYYAEVGSKLFERLQQIIDTQQVLDQLKTQVAEVKLWESPQEGKYPAVLEEGYIEVSSYGGDTNGYRIAFTVHYTGEKKTGLFDVTTCTFTEE